MSATVPLRCRCGAVRGVLTGVSPAAGNRVVCYCDDCQAFARFLGQDGIVDPQGGTDIFHTCPSQLRIAAGAEHLACVRLSEKGMFRWYTDCCQSPIGNMLGARFPFIGLVVGFMDTTADGKTAFGLLGAPSAYIFGKFAAGGCPAHVHPSGSPKVLLRSGKLMLKWWLGERNKPQPFFNTDTGAPEVHPRILGKAERSALG